MKKLLLIIPVLLLLVGCGSKTGTLKCSMSQNNVLNNYSLKSEYTVNYKGDYVTKVESKEVVTSESSSILDYFESALNTTYDNMSKTYGGYTFKVTKDGNTVTSTVTIDYDKMNVEKLYNDESSLKNYIKDNHLTVDGIKSMYASMGITCE